MAFGAQLERSDGIQVLEGRTFVDRPRTSLAEVAPVNETGGYLWSCNFAINRNLFLSLGGFDERFPFAAMEDVDFRDRLQKQGERFKFVPDASVCHPWRRYGGWKEGERHAIGTMIYLSLHPDRRSTINSAYYLKTLVREMVRVTIPGLVRYRGRGVNEALLRHLSSLWMAIRLAI
jgi:GT2 family glycosyltransferase